MRLEAQSCQDFFVPICSQLYEVGDAGTQAVGLVRCL